MMMMMMMMMIKMVMTKMMMMMISIGWALLGCQRSQAGMYLIQNHINNS